MKGMKQSIAALIALALFSLIAFVPKQVVSAPIASNAENIVYNEDTKTLTVSGEVMDTEIIQARKAGTWYQTVEHVYFVPGTVLSITNPLDDSTVVGLFSDVDVASKNCVNLQSILMADISYQNATGDSASVCVLSLGTNCAQLYRVDLSSPTFDETNKPVFSLPLNNNANTLQECVLTGWSASMFTVDSGGIYRGPDFFNYMGISSIVASAKLWQNLPHMRHEYDPFPDFDYGNWTLSTDSSHFTSITTYTEWEAYCKDLDPDQIVYCMRDNTPDVQTVFDANGGYFGSEDIKTTTVSSRPLSTLSIPNNPSSANPELFFLGYSSNPAGLAPEIIPGDITTYPIAAQAAPIYYAVWQYRPLVKTIFIAGRGCFDSGEHTLVKEAYVGDTVKLPIIAFLPEGQDFLGWFTELYGGNKVDETYVVPASASAYVFFYAHYSGNDSESWQEDGNGWRYLVEGEAVSGWQWIEDSYGAHWYYFNEDTYMATNQWMWDEGNSSWYWLCSSGPMIQGLWQWIDNEWYGFWWDGKMCRGWVWDNAWQAWFYCYNNGIMARNTWEGPYWLNWEGIWVR